MKIKKCPYCGVCMKKDEINIKFKLNPSILIKKTKALVCPKCDLELVSEKEADKTLADVKKIERSKFVREGKVKVILA